MKERLKQMISTSLVNVAALYDTHEFMNVFSVTSNMYQDKCDTSSNRIDVNHNLDKTDMKMLEILIASTVTEFLKTKDNNRRFEWMISLTDEEKLEMLQLYNPNPFVKIKNLKWLPFCQECSVNSSTKYRMLKQPYGYHCTNCSKDIGFDLKPIVVPKRGE